ncbi:hypothetical protein Q8A73_016975 [Channa argus]|nr:hypothetical protein Q8A73_016975 [Channa argus]
MAFANQGRSIPWVGLRRTLRFQWRSSDRELRLIRLSLQEAIRADASVRVTLVPEGGDLRVKLSQYADDTTLLLDSDECVVRALQLFKDFGRVSGARHNIGKCTVKGGGRVVMLLRVDYQRVKGQ